MSGTSLDGVDAVLAEFTSGAVCTLLAFVHVGFPAELRRELMKLQAASEGEIPRAARAANALADLYAQALRSACAAARIAAADIVAAGVHGQTVRHRPDEGWTLQINNPARVAERAQVCVVADFRARDIAAGGQGAPLVPAFHAAMFAAADRHRVVVNVGGIANVTDLPPDGNVHGFDTGPGNVLLDLWCARQRGLAFDDHGAWAASGIADSKLLAALLDEPYFAAPPPKSTGRDLFNAPWLDRALSVVPGMRRAEDVQATLVALTARTLANAVRAHCAGAVEMLVCGGGASNAALMAAIARELPRLRIGPTDAAGVASGHVEALAFAWLAREAIAGRPGNVPAVTGASGPRVLGAIYPR
ncbi:MAG: anhydro-N-acetylmuramic acid kinase [Burkholderiales bacterium]|nr:anhydro-N-acetylmuramic acid kinase [Burkholderiales bacterium]